MGGRSSGMEAVEKPDRVRRLVPEEVAALRKQVARLSERVWRKESGSRENDDPCFGHTRHIVFRFVPRVRAVTCWYANPIWSVWSGMLLPLMDRAAALYGYSQPVYPRPCSPGSRPDTGLTRTWTTDA